MNNKTVRILLFALSGLLFAAGAFLLLRNFIRMPGKYDAPPTEAERMVFTAPTPKPTIRPAGAKVEENEPLPSPTPVSLADPVMISFPEGKLQCPVEPVGVDSDGAMDAVPDAKIAGWYRYGVSPGEPGNALLDGHVRWKGELGTFSYLKEMELGEEVVIEYSDGSFRSFHVDSIETYLAEDVPLETMDLDLGGEPKMTLITCAGDFDETGHSKSRVIVICK